MTHRPDSLNNFIGQPRVTSALSHVVNAAKARGDAAHHVLFQGPPGTGKTSLALLIADAMGVETRQVTGPALQTIADFATVAMSMPRNGVLFIDEIHAMPRRVEEVAQMAMEDRVLDIVCGPSPKMPLRIPLEPFTVVGATTRLAKVNQPLRDRFGLYHTFALDYYDTDVLANILKSNAVSLGMTISPDAVDEIARRGRGTPRIAIDLLVGVRDYAQALNVQVSQIVASKALDAAGIDNRGLNGTDRAYLYALKEKFLDNPAGIEAIAAVMNIESSTLDSVVEPWLLRLGFIQRTPRGRILTDAGREHLRA